MLGYSKNLAKKSVSVSRLKCPVAGMRLHESKKDV